MLIFNLSRFSLKTAAPKDKIKSFSINDPHLKSFIYSNERDVDWNNVKNESTLNGLIIGLINNLKQKIDPLNENNHYLKDIDLEREFEINGDIDHVKAARRVSKSDPEAAKKIILEPINKEKHNSFTAWWDYINKTYRNYPAFIYCILKPVINSSTAKDKAGPTTVNAEAIAELFELVKKEPRLNYLKVIRRLLLELILKVQISLKVHLGLKYHLR